MDLAHADALKRDAQRALTRWRNAHHRYSRKVSTLGRQLGSAHRALARLRIMSDNGRAPLMSDAAFAEYIRHRRLRLERERKRRARAAQRAGGGA